MSQTAKTGRGGRRLAIAIAFGLIAFSSAAGPATPIPVLTDWDKLLPPDERGDLATDPGAVHGYLGEAAPAAKQTGSSKTNPALAGKWIKIPGYIVPIDVGRDGRIKEFFLVPYLGACIHVPPPPPNQMVYVTTVTPIKISSMDDVFWITGTLTIGRKGTRMASAAYTLLASRVEPYD